MKQVDKNTFLRELQFKVKFIRKSEEDQQIIELKKHKYEMITKEDLILEYENETLVVNRFISASVAQEDFEFCAILRDYMTILKGDIERDLLTYYTLTEEDKKEIDRLTEQTFK